MAPTREALVEEAHVFRIERHGLVAAFAEEFAVADAFGPERAAVARAHVGVAREGGFLGVRARQRLPLAVEAVGHEGAVVAGAVFADALDEEEDTGWCP